MEKVELKKIKLWKLEQNVFAAYEQYVGEEHNFSPPLPSMCVYSVKICLLP